MKNTTDQLARSKHAKAKWLNQCIDNFVFSSFALFLWWFGIYIHALVLQTFFYSIFRQAFHSFDRWYWKQWSRIKYANISWKYESWWQQNQFYTFFHSPWIAERETVLLSFFFLFQNKKYIKETANEPEKYIFQLEMVISSSYRIHSFVYLLHIYSTLSLTSAQWFIEIRGK